MKETQKTFDTYGIGSAIMDYQVRVSENEFNSFNLVKGSMTLINKETKKNLLKTLSPNSIKKTSGGSIANSIITLACLGAKTSFCSLIGEDEDGELYKKEMEKLGIFITKPKERYEGDTGSSIILITEDAERTMSTHLGINELIDKNSLDKETLSNSKWLYIEGFLFSSKKGRELIKEAIKVSKENNVKVALSLSDVFIVKSFKEPLTEAIRDSNLIFSNLNEAKELTSGSNLDSVVRELKNMAKDFVVTLGKDGSFSKIGKEQIRAKAYKTKALNTTGAGDTFSGAFLFGLINNKLYSLEKTVDLASLLASKVVSQEEARLNTNLKKYL